MGGRNPKNDFKSVMGQVLQGFPPTNSIRPQGGTQGGTPAKMLMQFRCKRFLQGFPQGEPQGGNPAQHKILWSPRLRTMAVTGFRRRLERGRRNISRITPLRWSDHWEIPIHSVSLGVSPGEKPSWIRAEEFHHRFPRGFP